MDAFISGSWRTPRRAEILIGGVWRSINRAEVYIGGGWRPCMSFAEPLTVSVSPSSVTGTGNASRPTRLPVASNPTTAYPAGGKPPYSYAWTVSGGAVATSPNTATTGFSAALNAGYDLAGYAEIACTDAAGVTASASVAYYLNNKSGDPV